MNRVAPSENDTAAATRENKIQNLRRTRDLLRPRLLSGTLDAPESWEHVE